MTFSAGARRRKISVYACALVATDNKQDLTPIYPQIYGITQLFADHWFDLQP